jgi:tol-pal system protein YbgF
VKLRLLAAACAAVFSVQAQAGLFDDEEARTRVEKLRAEFAELQKRVDTTSKNSLDFANQFETLKADISRLRGQIEVLTYELEAAQKRQKDFYVDLDNRLRKLEPGAEARPGDAKPATPAADPAAETRDYEAALGAFRGAKYKDALGLLTAFIANYPKSAFQASAHYWAASSHYQLKDYPRAAELFGTVAAKWPDDPKAPDALLNQANAYAAAGDAKNSRKALELLVEKYPASQPAQGAKLRLKKK